MRNVVALLLVLTQSSLAAECLPVADSPSGPQIVLRGVIEYKPVKSAPGTLEIVLKLDAPVCVEGVGRDGLPFKKEDVKTIMLGLPDNLAVLQPHTRVELRGAILDHSFNEKSEPVDDLTFVVSEVR
jgi:hypothetical protein